MKQLPHEAAVHCQQPRRMTGDPATWHHSHAIPVATALELVDTGAAVNLLQSAAAGHRVHHHARVAHKLLKAAVLLAQVVAHEPRRLGRGGGGGLTAYTR